MPGGLAITAAKVETWPGDHPERQQSKDIWVLSDQPVEPFSLMGGLQSVAEFRRGSDLPSRVADHLLWLGRYLERAEGAGPAAAIDLIAGFPAKPDREDIPELPFLLNLLQGETTLPPVAGRWWMTIPRYRELSSQL
jgi:hypothetical protein